MQPMNDQSQKLLLAAIKLGTTRNAMDDARIEHEKAVQQYNTAFAEYKEKQEQ